MFKLYDFWGNPKGYLWGETTDKRVAAYAIMDLVKTMDRIGDKCDLVLFYTDGVKSIPISMNTAQAVDWAKSILN